jgi:hypothetical protein
MKTYHVEGYAFVPVKIELTIAAPSAKEAEAEALERWNILGSTFRNEHVVSGSEDYSAVFGFEPHAEEDP